MRSNALFSPWNEVTSHPRKLPALRAEVASGAPSRRHAFILLLVVAGFISLAPPQAAELAHFAAPPLPTATASLGCGGGPILRLSTVAQGCSGVTAVVFRLPFMDTPARCI